MLVITAIEGGQARSRDLLVKGATSSLMRSLFSGDMLVLRDMEMPLFKVERKQLNEITVATSPQPAGDRNARSRASCQGLSEVVTKLGLGPRQWLIVANAASLALRNIDHLVPMDIVGEFAPPQVDFYWAKAGRGAEEQDLATPGIWAVRMEHLPLVLARWKEELGNGIASSDDEIWTRVVRSLTLKKKLFEKGEVVAPRVGGVDWTAVSNSAFVTLPDWPDQEAWKFLQALYFGTFLGDGTGMMLHVLEA